MRRTRISLHLAALMGAACALVPCRAPAAAPRCPDGYVLVPHDPAYVSVDFCVAKYEMKRVGGKPASRAAGLPWTDLNRAEAIASCVGLGPGYHLINLYEWQNLARDIERTNANWSLGEANAGDLNVGNYGLEKGAAGDDRAPCVTPGFKSRFPECDVPRSKDWGRKRTHVLSNGAIVWDVGGNYGELVSTDRTALADGRALTCELTGAARYLYGPGGSYSTCSPERGLGFLEGSGGPLIWRGLGAGAEGTAWENARGIFYANTNSFWTADKKNDGIGFRCAFIAPGLGATFGTRCGDQDQSGTDDCTGERVASGQPTSAPGPRLRAGDDR